VGGSSLSFTELEPFMGLLRAGQNGQAAKEKMSLRLDAAKIHLLPAHGEVFFA
jgi:hypothetical protein